MRKLTLPALITTLVLSPLVACVPKDKYVAAMADAQQAHAQLEASEKAHQAEEADLRQQLADAQQKSQELDQRLSDLSTADHNLQARLDESTAIGAQLRTEPRSLERTSIRCSRRRGPCPRRWTTPKVASTSCERRRPLRRRAQSSSRTSFRSSSR